MKFSLKKSLLITFILVELSAVLAIAGSPVLTRNADPDEITVLRPTISISFEIARRRDCLGFGFCNFTLEFDFNRINSGTGTMYLDDSKGGGNFIIEINKATGINPEGYTKYFKSGTFLMEDDSPIPGNILKGLGISGDRTLLAGKHKITERNGLIYISIPAR